VYTLDSILTFEGCNTFSGNSAWYYGGGVHSQNSTLKFSGNTNFSSSIIKYSGGAIHGVGTALYYSGINSFTANAAGRGGEKYLANSFIFLSRDAIIIMNNNSARRSSVCGGLKPNYLLQF